MHRHLYGGGTEIIKFGKMDIDQNEKISMKLKRLFMLKITQQ